MNQIIFKNLFTVILVIILFPAFGGMNSDNNLDRNINKNCIKLISIDVDDNKLFDKIRYKSLLSEHNNKCINTILIQHILKRLSNLYNSNGYITTKPFLKPQNINSGIIKISIVVGKITNIIDSKTKQKTNKIFIAFIGQKNKPLNLRNVETSLEAINRVPSVKAEFKIKPGKDIRW